MSVRARLCGPHVFVCKGNGWQWKMWPILILIAAWKNSLCICGFCPDEQRRRGLSMKAYFLSQLKSVLTYRHPFEVRLAAILERSAPVLNNGNWIGEKKWLNRAKGKVFLLLFIFFPPLEFGLIQFSDRFSCAERLFFFSIIIISFLT